MAAPAAPAAPVLPRSPLGGRLLRLRSDEQLLASFRAGNDDAFRVLHDRHRRRLFAYVRQMLAASPRQDAEDVLQDVFVRAYGALRRDEREVNVRAWLYRVAHNRCIDQLRRPAPAPEDLFDLSRAPEHDPVEETQRRDDLRRLVEDVGRLPPQQRSALLMREIDGLPYADMADALGVTVPAVKSLLVRARVGLVEAAASRDADCTEIRRDLARSWDRGVKASAHARRHLRSCAGCREYRGALRGTRRSLAALAPVGAGPLALVAQLMGLGGGAGAGGAAALGGGGIAGAATGKVAAMACTAALAGGAVEVGGHYARAHPDPAPRPAAPAAASRPSSPGPAPVRAGVPAPAHVAPAHAPSVRRAAPTALDAPPHRPAAEARPTPRAESEPVARTAAPAARPAEPAAQAAPPVVSADPAEPATPLPDTDPAVPAAPVAPVALPAAADPAVPVPAAPTVGGASPPAEVPADPPLPATAQPAAPADVAAALPAPAIPPPA